MDTLKIKSLKKSYQQSNTVIHVLKEVSYDFRGGKSYAITGPSGSGKSTLLHLLAGLDAPEKGNVFFNNQDINAMHSQQKEQFRNQAIGLVFQLPYLIAELSVLENVKIKGIIKGLSSQECEAMARHLLNMVGLEHKAQHNPLTLSGGEQQRVSIARALFNKPAFLLADEPTGNLDVNTGNKIVDLILACQKEWNMGVIISSHDEYVTQKMATVLHLENGHLTTR